MAYEDATVEWVDCNLGSKLTMKYPSIYLLGERAHSDVLSITFAGAGQHQDAGAKIIHAAPNTTSNIFAKSICKDGGRGSYRGLLEIAKGARGSKSKVVCDALLLDDHSRSDTYPTIRISEDDVNVGHEATVSRVGEEQLFYLMSHGIREEEASKLIVNGFVEPIVKELPMEYAVEMNRLIELQMEGSIGYRDKRRAPLAARRQRPALPQFTGKPCLETPTLSRCAGAKPLSPPAVVAPDAPASGLSAHSTWRLNQVR